MKSALQIVMLLFTQSLLADGTLREVRVVDEVNQPMEIASDDWNLTLQSSLGKPLDEAMRVRLADGLLGWFARHDRPVMSVEEGSIDDGVLTFQATAGRVNEVFMKDGTGGTKKVAAARWQHLRGEPLRLSSLEKELAWFHRNPLHIATLSMSEAASNDAAPLADVIVDLEQTRSVRVRANYRNDGISPLSAHRMGAGIEVADLFGLPSWLTWQSTTADEVESYQQHGAAARFFLPWRHELALSAGMVRVSAPSEALAGFIDSITAESWQSSARYIMPFMLGRAWELDFGLGADFRSTNNTLELGALTLAGDAESTSFVADLVLHKQTLLRDTGASLSLGYSPGGVTDADNDPSHGALRQGAKAEHFITRASIWHRRENKQGWSMSARVTGQWSDRPVLPQDQLMLTGSYSVRGFDEASVLSDRGIWGSVEGRGPVWRLWKDCFQMQPLTFVDAGVGRDVVRDEQAEVAGSGVGMRFSICKHLSATCAYAWRMTEPCGRFHLAVTTTF